MLAVTCMASSLVWSVMLVAGGWRIALCFAALATLTAGAGFARFPSLGWRIFFGILATLGTAVLLTVHR